MGNDDAGASHDRPVDNLDETRPEKGSGAVTAELLDQQWGHQQQEQQQHLMMDSSTEQPTATVERGQDQPMGQVWEEQGQDEEVEEVDQPPARLRHAHRSLQSEQTASLSAGNAQ